MRTLAALTAALLISLLAAVPASARGRSATSQGTLSVNPAFPADMSDFTISGTGFIPGHTYHLRLNVGIGAQDVTTDGSGAFTSTSIQATVTDTDYTAYLITLTGRIVATLTFPVGSFTTCSGGTITESITVQASAPETVIVRDALTGCGAEAAISGTSAVSFLDTQCPVLLYAEAFVVDSSGNLTPTTVLSVACQ